MAVYLAVDLGTTGCRSIIFNDSLREIASSYEEYPLITSQANFVEQDAELWWNLTIKTAKAAIAKSEISPSDIDGISISSQGITIVPVDKQLRPLYNALTWLDTRAKETTDKIENDFSNDAIFTITGKSLSSCYTLPKILWIKENLPDVYKATYKFLMPLDFLTARFTGRCFTDFSMATGTLMYDIRKLCWCDEILNKYEISKDLLPEVLPAGSVVGTVLPEVANQLNLKSSCKVVLGAQDQKCAAYGVGLGSGVMTISLGTAAAVTKLWNEAKTEINNGIGWCGYIDENSFVTEGVINTAGTCLRWIRDTLYQSENYSVIDKEAEYCRDKNNKNPLFFYPFMNGASSPNHYPESTGVFYGMNLATTRGNFALAVMEGIAYQIKIILDAMKAYENIHTLIIFGGVARSKFWCQIIADITGMKIYVPLNLEAAGAGAARLASVGCGSDTGPLTYENSYEPSHYQASYKKKFAKYKEIEQKLWEIK